MKTLRQAKTGIKVSALFILLPSIIMALQSGKKDKKEVKKIITKFIRSTLYITVFGALPAIVFALYSKAGGRVLHSELRVALCFIIGGFSAFLIEKPDRHIQLLGFLMQRAVESLFNVLQRKGMYKWH